MKNILLVLIVIFISCNNQTETPTVKATKTSDKQQLIYEILNYTLTDQKSELYKKAKCEKLFYINKSYYSQFWGTKDNCKEFSLKVTMKGGYWNYDECKFGNTSTPIAINGAKMDKNEESRKMIMGLYTENLPLLEDNEYKPWSSELRDKIYNYIGQLTGNPGKSYSSVAAPSTPVAGSFAGTTVNNTTSTPTPTQDTKAGFENANQAANSNDGEIEDWLKEFDIK
jgi:hypothetical protein